MTTVNKQEKIIYVHIPKCAGSSIEKIEWLGGGGHVNYRHIENRYNMNEFFKFTTIRNPLDRLVSAYFHFVQYPLKKNESQADQDCYKYIKKHYAMHMDRVTEGFPEFIENFPEKLFRINHFNTQKFFIENKKGKIKFDYIIDFAHLQNGFSEVCKLLNKEQIELPHAKASKHKPFIQYYTPELIVKVDKMYREDIELYTKFGGN